MTARPSYHAIGGITDRVRLKLHRDDLLRYLERGLSDSYNERPVVHEMSAAEYGVIQAEIIRIDNVLSGIIEPTWVKEKQLEKLRRIKGELLTKLISYPWKADAPSHYNKQRYKLESRLRIIDDQISKLK